jgi:uncharacterized protein
MSTATRAVAVDAAMPTITPSMLAQAWTPEILQWTDEEDSSRRPVKGGDVSKAVERTLPLLEGADSVPFVCRYRTDIIHPLSTKQVHVLQSLLTQHTALSSLRLKLLKALNADNNTPLPLKVLTSTSKAELEDWYAPYKPPPKGSILQRIQTEHPQLVQAVDDLWAQNKPTKGAANLPFSSLGPRDALLHLLGSKIAADPDIVSVVTDELQKHCRIHTKIVVPSKTKKKQEEQPKTSRSSSSSASQTEKYTHYDDYRGNLMYLKDHQVLAIRRGVNQKQLSISYDIDGTKMESCIAYHLRFKGLAPEALVRKRELFQEAIHDAWTRLLRRRGTSRLWTAKCQQAQERAYQVFQDNLGRALLAPPLDLRRQTTKQQQLDWAPFLLALDPGYQAGIKCAILDFQGVPQHLDTVHFLGPRRQAGVDKLIQLLKEASGDGSNNGSKVLVAMGNGHGSQDCRMLLQEAATASQILVDVQLVNEAGASVWSVTETAKREFPDETPAAIASISIGRRLLNPLFELVKVPPRSLGLGMYQHDLSEKELDERLHLGSVDAVATVGVDVNSCSLEILECVPGIQKLAPKIMAARPLHQRSDLLKVAGLGPKTFENSAAFLRLTPAVEEPLDATLVHPESYDLARWLLKKSSWKLDQPIQDLPPRSEWRDVWESLLEEASTKFQVSQDRALAVLGNLVDSINRVDPRIKELKTGSSLTDPCAASVEGCTLLPSNLAESKALATSAPVRGILGVVRNISDFGAFIDFGGHNDGLLHKSKLGANLRLENLLIGQSIGVDILGVQGDKVSLGVHGLRSVARHEARRPGDASSYSTARTNVSRKRKR